MSDIAIWDCGRAKVYQDENGNYGLRIYDENNVPIWDTATGIAEAQKKNIPKNEVNHDGQIGLFDDGQSS